MSLSTTLADLEQNLNLSKIELEAINPKVRPSFEKSVREAKSAVVRLNRTYKEGLLENALAYFVYGDTKSCEAFAQLAQNEANCIVLDSSEVYDRFTSVVLPSFGEKGAFTATHISLLVPEIRNVMVDTGLSDIASPELKTLAHLNNKSELRSFIKDLINKSNGTLLNRAYLEFSLFREALKDKRTDGTLPVVVLNSSPSEYNELKSSFKKGSEQLELTADMEISKEYVLSIFNKTKKSLKKEKNKENSNV